ncbi:MAG: hypothetical protein HC838_17945 [Spirulinaceae cyanobacterium RM2_2_10]|nr:hypothetical protein [Spirulinaceae cyanobacterium SM2_1_0]NJO21543.1 hypothetical protein [Spirulinaceae cyanobacterium RM2_2_10]
MDTLGYTHMAMAYEESYGPLGIRSFEPSPHCRWQRVTSAIVIASLLTLAGLTAIVSSALTPRNATPQQQATGL